MDASSEAQSDPDRAGADSFDSPEGEARDRDRDRPEKQGARRGRGRRRDPYESSDEPEREPPPLPSGPGLPEPKIVRVDVPSENVDEDALKVIRRLRRYGHHAYLVGGGVRDLLLGKRPKDFDIATSARPNEVRALFRNCRIIGRRFRLAHILFGGGKVIEVATFRRDPLEAFDQAEGEFAEEMEALDAPPQKSRRREDVDLLIRHDNVFGEPHEDALRRDFRINGLFYDTETHNVIDYVGGMEDIERRVVRTIGAPDLRFREDPVRILRAIKFSARCDLGIDPDLYDAMVAQREELARAARPRLLEEVLRLLRGGASHRSFWLMWETGCLGVLVPQLAMHLDDDSVQARRLWGRLDAIDRMKKADTLPGDAVLLAVLLLGPIEEVILSERDMAAFESLMDEIAVTLAIPRRMKERVRNIVQSQGRVRSGKLGALPRRDYFDDALTLLAIECDARGERRPDWIERTGRSESEAPEPKRRRRRRRRP
jgi:poly(A) polymerase